MTIRQHDEAMLTALKKRAAIAHKKSVTIDGVIVPKDEIHFSPLEMHVLALAGVESLNDADRAQGVTTPLNSTSDFTCTDCAVASQCEYIYDSYNTGGDCLADK
jgi:hypothetical protein